MKIGELARCGGTTTKTIRFYEQAGVLPAPARTPSGYREYEPEFVDRLEFIRRAQAAGLSLQEVRQVLAIADRGDQSVRTCREHLAGSARSGAGGADRTDCPGNSSRGAARARPYRRTGPGGRGVLDGKRPRRQSLSGAD